MGKLTTEELDRLQFGRVMHERPQMTDSVTSAIRRTQEAIERDGVNMSKLVDLAKQMPSSLNDACRTIEVMGDEIERLQDAKRAALKLANEHAMKVNELRQQLDNARAALIDARHWVEGSTAQVRVLSAEEGNHDECGMQTWCECDCAGPEAIGLPHPEDIVGHKTFDTGEICPETGFPKMRHDPLTRAEADSIWEACQKAHEDRVARMPDEKSALNTMHDAYTRLKDMGWRDAIYCPKDGSHFQAIEAGSTGIHDCAYWGEWPNGHWNVFDGDVWPAHPILFKLYPEDQAKEDARREEARKRFAEARERGEL